MLEASTATPPDVAIGEAPTFTSVYGQIRDRDRAIGAEVDEIAAQIAKAIVGNVATALCQADLVAITPKGHYLEFDLTSDGRAWLLSTIEPMVRGRLHDQRISGALDEFRDRLSLGLGG